MTHPQQFVTLSNGNKVPGISIVGTGTKWFKYNPLEDKYSHELVSLLKEVLTLPGVVHIDCAEMYLTHQEVGEGLEGTKKPRNEIFITDKYSIPKKLSINPIAGLELALKDFGLKYVDLYLLHFPDVDEKIYGFNLERAWKMMEELYEKGLAKNIGVSNFRVTDLERINKIAKIKPQVNQIEFNAFLQNQSPGIYEYCQKENIQLEGYCPLVPLRKGDGNDEIVQYIKSLAEKYKKTDSQVLLRWVTKMNVIPVTTSGKFQRIKDAQFIWDFDLTDAEVTKIKELGVKHKPVRSYWKEFFDKE